MGMTAIEGQVANMDVNDTSSRRTTESGTGSDNYVYVNSESISGAQETISIKSTEQWTADILKDPKNELALSALSTGDATKILNQRASNLSNKHIYNVKIALEGSPMTNQRASGRCWLFAATNVLRVAIMKKYNLKDFELSQTYLFFWDKLEKANYFLEQVLDTLDEPLDGRLMQRLFMAPVQDGGQWDMVANLVHKYGLVPQQLYPDVYSASNSRTLSALITTKLREYCLQLRDLAQTSKSSIPDTKERMIREIHQILVLMLGPPPPVDQEFTWEFYDRNDQYASVTTKPVDLAKTASVSNEGHGFDVTRLFSLVNDPRNDYTQLLGVSRLGNVWEGHPVRYVNVDMTTMKTAAIAMLKADVPVFFGSDVGKYSARVSGIMDTALIDYEIAFNVKLGMTKAQRLKTGESEMTHAMVLTAVHLDEKTGEPVRWRVQNSWGEDSGSKGFFVMSDAWMDQFVYQIVVDPHFVPEEITNVLKQDPKMLPLWDPMGALA